MNVSSSQPVLRSTEATPSENQAGASSAHKAAPNRGFLRPVAACGGALLLGALMVRLAPPPTTAKDAALPDAPVTSAPMVLSASQLVKARLVPAKLSARMLSGGWKLSTDALGHAQVSGEIARWAVEPGARVQAGDRVVEISTGAESQPVPVVERTRQRRAERTRIETGGDQAQLSQSLSVARTQLAAAQERVGAAQEKVASTRSLVKRLMDGEKIPVKGGAPTRKRRKIRVRRDVSDDSGASRDDGLTPAEVERAKSRAQGAKSELDDAKSALAGAERAAKSTAGALSRAETDFGAEKITADALQSAHDAADEAAANLKAAQTRVDVAEHTANSRQSKADAAEEEARRARSAAAKKREAAPPVEETVEEPDTDDGGRYMTADQAAPLAEEALREAKTAIRQADRVHARVAEYERQVKQTSRRVVVAAHDLEDTQETVMRSVPRAVFVSQRAPVSGTITWISRLAREVGVGQPIFGISRGGNRTLRFDDASGAWKLLKVGQTLRAASGTMPDTAAPEPQPVIVSSDVQTKLAPVMPPSQPSGSASAQPGAPLAQPDAPLAPMPVPPAPTFSIRITRITPPTREGGTATIDAQSLDSAPPSDEKNVQAELPLDVLPIVLPGSPSGAKSVVVPASVVLPRDGGSFVAVVETPVGKAAKSPSLTWRAVQIERQTAFDVEIKSGLHEGEQVVDQPILLLSQLKPEDKKPMPIVVQATN